jgi:hypothetical protein
MEAIDSRLCPEADRVDPYSHKLTWAGLVRLEPRLLDLLREARALRKEQRRDPHFCANAAWYGYGRWRGHGLKPRLVRLVGWSAEGGDPILATRAAYDVAYQTVYEALPACRACGCMRPGP